ncbi:hypothetical protein MYX06_01830 [Patescibacteria group bacterium AH-259-L05]|nr:hypothetical protein [Patescibacteria group bacterium AH-259-L05]
MRARPAFFIVVGAGLIIGAALGYVPATIPIAFIATPVGIKIQAWWRKSRREKKTIS